MNPKSLEKIRAATSFLRWFRSSCPDSIQHYLRPYLDQPYQLALRLMDCCDGSEYGSLAEIAAAAKISKNTACQVLSALRDSGLIVMINTAKGLQPLERDRLEIRQVTLPSSEQMSKQPYSGFWEEQV